MHAHSDDFIPDLPRKFTHLALERWLWLVKGFNSDERIMLAEIDSLSCHKKGCYAQNAHFAALIEKSERIVQMILKDFAEMGLVTIEHEASKEDVGGHRRWIKLTGETPAETIKNCIEAIRARREERGGRGRPPKDRDGDEPSEGAKTVSQEGVRKHFRPSPENIFAPPPKRINDVQAHSTPGRLTPETPCENPPPPPPEEYVAHEALVGWKGGKPPAALVEAGASGGGGLFDTKPPEEEEAFSLLMDAFDGEISVVTARELAQGYPLEHIRGWIPEAKAGKNPVGLLKHKLKSGPPPLRPPAAPRGAPRLAVPADQVATYRAMGLDVVAVEEAPPRPEHRETKPPSDDEWVAVLRDRYENGKDWERADAAKMLRRRGIEL